MYGIAGLLTGRTLAGRYRIEAVIGRGGMGAVYRATDERLSRQVAVKVIGTSTTDLDEHARLRARFHREARAAAALHHPNVAQVHDFGTDPELELDFLVMELLQGEDLAARLVRSGPPPLGVSLSILRQAARGLAAGHRAGMVHRDVKPGNLFLEAGDTPDEPRVRVLDFGIAQVEADENGTLTHLTAYGRSPHSPAYASPEQLRGDASITPASDVFSLGAVGYHLLTGSRPFLSGDPERAALETAEAVRRLHERAPELELSTHAALVRALALRPAERFRDAGELAEALGAGVTSLGGRRPSPAPLSVSSAEDDATRLYESDPAPRPVSEPRPATTFSTPAARGFAPAPEPRPVAQVSAPAPVVPAPAAAAASPLQPQTSAALEAAMRAADRAMEKRPGRVRRFFHALWDFTVTTASLLLFVAAWWVAASGVVEDDPRRIWAGAAASVLFTPFAVHRLTGRRGRYGMGVLGALLASGLAVYYVGMDADPAIGLAAVFGLQILTCFALSWLTRRRPRKARDDEQAAPVQAMPAA
jgi:serine/threonine protein kinase